MPGAPIGSEVGLYYDSREYRVAEGDYIRTATGRTYLVISVRVAERGKHAGVRQHLRCIVVDFDHPQEGDRVYPLQWYRRGRR